VSGCSAILGLHLPIVSRLFHGETRYHHEDKSVLNYKPTVNETADAANHVSKLQDVVHRYDATAEELDDKVTKLEAELKDLKTVVKAEQNKS
jgi:peptidoglycan hydrolase CwlO-like protein